MADKKARIEKLTSKHPQGTRARLKKAAKLHVNHLGTPSMSNAIREYIEAGLKKDGL